MRNAFAMIHGLQTAMYVGKRLVWDWKNIIDRIQNGNLEFSENDIGPARIDDEYIEFCKIILNIRSLIYQNCKVNDLIDGWNELSKTLDLVRVLELFLSTSMSRLKDVDVSEIHKFEPDVIDFLKICCWYSRLRTTVSVVHKIKELRVRLAKKLLYRLETGKVPINYNGISSEEIQKMISNAISELGKEPMDINKRRQLLSEYYDFVSVTISELMYPSLAQEYGHRISFVPRNMDFDFDMKVENILSK
jgi:hypothetical protein